MKSHLDTQCPCYCPYCDITAKREVISREHKEKCHKFPLTCPSNTGVDNIPCDKLDNEINELQDEVVNDVFGSSVLIELQNNINMATEEAAQSLQIAKQRSDKINKQTDSTMLSKLYDIRLYLTIAVLIIAILIALLVQSHYRLSELQQQNTPRQEQLQKRNTKLQEQMTQLQEQIIQLQQQQTKQNTQLQEQQKKQNTQLQEQQKKHNTQLQEQITQLQEQITQLQEQQKKQNTQLQEQQKKQNTQLQEQQKKQITQLQEQQKKHNTQLQEQITQLQEQITQLQEQQKKQNTQLQEQQKKQNTQLQEQQKKQITQLQEQQKKHNTQLQEQITQLQEQITQLQEQQKKQNTQLQEQQKKHNTQLQEQQKKQITQLQEQQKKHNTQLQEQITQLQEQQKKQNTQLWGWTTEMQDENYYRLSSLVWPIKLWWLSSEFSNQLTPAIVKMSSFTKKLKDKEEWYSSSFVAFEEGYQMCLNVIPAGSGIGEGTHVSVYLYLMKGPHDDELKQSGHWPLRGTFTIELLNQLNDSDHHSFMLHLNHQCCSECTERVTGIIQAQANVGYGYSQFISHDTLLYHSNTSYLKSDYLMFRISYEHMEVPSVTFDVTKFSNLLKAKKHWESTPFFALEGGYQMCLLVYVAGYDKGEGTHVSVYLYLMKGPHDDKLEQSGHWPLRGISTITIELLNQLHDDNHRMSTTKFDASRSVNKMNQDGRATIKALPDFISHDTIFQYFKYSYSVSYIKDDMLKFRITYLANGDASKRK